MLPQSKFDLYKVVFASVITKKVEQIDNLDKKTNIHFAGFFIAKNVIIQVKENIIYIFSFRYNFAS